MYNYRKGEVALLAQDSSFFTMLTPREILSIASFLQLSEPESVRELIVDRTIEALGLSSVQHNRVGDRFSGSGISGGEKRRLAVAVELVTRPKVFLADEPTTGLDSFQAERVIRLMGELAKERNIPCLCVLHQPRASIWKVSSFLAFRISHFVPTNNIFGKSDLIHLYYLHLVVECATWDHVQMPQNTFGV